MAIFSKKNNKSMKDNPEIITAFAAMVGSIVKAIKIRLKWRATLASVVIATMIGYLMPGLILYFMDDANQQLIIAVSILVGFSMHGITDIIEEQLKSRFDVSVFDKRKPDQNDKI